jgi:DNA-binding ferritin-like protein
MNLHTKVKFFLELQTQLKVYHWQTKGIARHEAFGKVYDELNDLTDEFVEQAMGQYGRFVLDGETKNIQIFNLSESNPKDVIVTCCDTLVSFTEDIDPKDTNLLNLRDEILGLLRKLLYLLTLE